MLLESTFFVGIDKLHMYNELLKLFFKIIINTILINKKTILSETLKSLITKFYF